MKRISLFTCLVVAHLTTLAQDCPICGDWYNTVNQKYYDSRTDEVSTGNVKVYLRIRKNGESYYVREKKIFPDGRIFYQDFEGYKYYTDDNDPKFLSWEEGEAYVEYDKDIKTNDGQFRIRYEYIKRNSISVSGNKMTYKSWLGVDTYRRAGPYYPDHHFGDWCPYPERERKGLTIITLFQDEGDW